MSWSRREFLAVSAAATAGCMGARSEPVALRSATIDAGPIADYAADGVYDRFKGDGFFIVRHGLRLIVLSSICTHRHCRLRAEVDHSFYCKCHGSTFDADGKVTEGPAVLNLPVLPSSIDADGRLIVHAVPI